MSTPVLVNGATGVSSTAIFVREQDCRLNGFTIYNPSNAAAYVQFFDMPASTAPTVGTTVPKWSVGVPTVAALSVPYIAGDGLFFTGGLWVAATTTAGGNTGPSAAVNVNLALG